MIIEREKASSEHFGEEVGAKVKTAIDKTVYFIVGVCIIGGISSVYFILRGIKNGWKKAGRAK